VSDFSPDLSNLTAEQKRQLLAQLLDEESALEKTARLSFAQERLWFLDQLQPGSPAYNVPMAVMLRAPDVPLLERVFEEIVARHEALRTTFAFEGGSPVQVIAPSLRVPIEVTDLRALAARDREQEAARLAREEARAPFDLATGPLLRARLLRLTTVDHQFLLTVHHIVCDGWSTGVLFQELNALYEAYRQGLPSPLPDLPVQYPEFAEWQRDWLQGETLDRQLGYWKPRLEGAPPLLELPTDKPRPVVQTFDGAIQPFRLAPSLSAELDRLSQREGVTLFMTLVAAFQTLLMRYSGQEDVVVGTPIAGRTRAEIEPLIGFFVNTLVLRTDLSGDPTFLELLARVKEVTLGAYAHQDLPFERLVEELQPERRVSHNPIFQVMFALQNLPAATSGGASNTGEDLPEEEPDEDDQRFEFQAGTETSKFDLTLSMGPSPDGLLVAFEYSTHLFEPATIRRMHWHLRTLLTSIAKNPDRRLSELRLLGEREVERVTDRRQAVYGLRRCRPLRAALRRTLARAIGGPRPEAERLADRAVYDAPAYVLDERGDPLPIGIVGEVHLDLERVHDNLPEAIRERLVPSALAMSPLYPTGERARRRRDGTLDWLGPRQRRFESGGYGIEPAPIEGLLERHPAVRTSLVVPHTDQDGRVHPIAYVVPAGRFAGAADGELAAELDRLLHAWLPDYTVPSAVLIVDRLRLREDGELDLDALPEPDFSAVATRVEFVAPRSPTEALVARIWTDVLGHDRIGVFDNFFDVGGNSLASIRIMARIKDQLGVELSLVRLFETPDVAGVAETLDAETTVNGDGAAVASAGSRVAAPEGSGGG
jgi:acyl carrier protein